MTDARVDSVYADRVRAREFLDQAERFWIDSNNRDLNDESQAVLLHNATVCACDAVLQAVGLRVTVGDNAHALRLETTMEQLGGATEDLHEGLDASRQRRNEVSCAASFIPETSLIDAHEATRELLERVRAMLGGSQTESGDAPPPPPPTPGLGRPETQGGSSGRGK